MCSIITLLFLRLFTTVSRIQPLACIYILLAYCPAALPITCKLLSLASMNHSDVGFPSFVESPDLVEVVTSIQQREIGRYVTLEDR